MQRTPRRGGRRWIRVVVVDRLGPQVVFGHPEGVLDAPQLVVGADHPGRVGVEDIGDVGLPAGQRPGLRLQLTVDAAGAAGQGDEPVPFDRRLPGDGLLSLGDLLLDAVHATPGPVGLVLIQGRAAPLIGLRAHDHRLGQRHPVGRLGARAGLPPLIDHIRHLG